MILLGRATDTLKSMSYEMRDSLARQEKEVDALDKEMDQTQGMLQKAMQGLNNLLVKVGKR